VPSCPACGEENPERAKFCLECGAALAAAAPRPALEERKVVTVLFCDLVGFTATSDAADPEDVRARIRPYHARLREEIERFGGTVEKFVGDAVMAVFGAPTAHEDDPERAVRAGLRILASIDELNADEPARSLQVRVGINTGEAVVALGARPEEGEGIVTGDVVNTASRLQGAAPVGGVAVSAQTHRATERIFEWERLEPVTVKGKAEPLALWRPLRARARFGLEVIRSSTTPLVGRELERTLLIGTFERAAQQVSSQLVTIVGEPGVGKSRLCAELLAYLDERPGLVRWRQGRCLPYGEGISFWALGEIVKAECGVLESDTPEQAATKLERVVAEDDPDRAWLLARLAPLVGAPAEPAGQEESFAAWRRFCESLATERPTVLLFEDLHWADPALLAFLEHLGDWAEGVPLLLLCTARPELYERHPTFGANARNGQRVNLAPLSDAETAQLVSALLERTVLPAETQQALLEQAGGNPLYAEEFVRLLADRSRPNEAVEVPDSVQALIAARLDTLAADRKSLLQDAAVLGKVFWAGALVEMGGRDRHDVERALHELARKELVRPARTSSMDGELEYGFWHVLVRDVCYGQIPRADRATRHQAAATWIEEKAGERVEDLADVLAYHYQSALELNRAAGIAEQADVLRAETVRYLALAGERAISLDVELAERHLARALELAPADDPTRASLLERWAQAAQQRGRMQEARQAFEEAVDLYRKQGRSLPAGRVLRHLGLVAYRLGDPRGVELYDEARRLLEAEPAGPELVSVYAYIAARSVHKGEFPEAIEAADQALTLAAELGLPESAFALSWRGYARSELGNADGVGDVRRALELALEQGAGRETGVIYGILALAVWGHVGPQAARDVVADAVSFCERRGITELTLQLRANAVFLLAELGQTDEALAEAGGVADRVEAEGDMSYLPARLVLLRLHAERGTAEQAPDPEKLVSAARHIGQFMASALAAAAQLVLARRQSIHAHGLLLELDALADIPADSDYASHLPSLVRAALALNDTPLAARFTARVRPEVPLRAHALASAQAQLAEAAHRHADAAQLYHEAAERWRAFGNVPERAYAMLGEGRCLASIDETEAEETLREAKRLFAGLGYKPALAEAESLLGESEAAAV
jgi:class 3 adenylate cyclase/tetratricopeptide (TPR) repeat protein